MTTARIIETVQDLADALKSAPPQTKVAEFRYGKTGFRPNPISVETVYWNAALGEEGPCSEKEFLRKTTASFVALDMTEESARKVAEVVLRASGPYLKIGAAEKDYHYGD